jgi:coenzyme PQQ precursor peptide PqqA
VTSLSLFKRNNLFSCPLKPRDLPSLFQIDIKTPAERIAAANSKRNNMNQSTDCLNKTKNVWETPIFQEIPISFEASSYALIEEDDHIRG